MSAGEPAHSAASRAAMAVFDDAPTVSIAAGNTFLQTGQTNRRLFLVRRGVLAVGDQAGEEPLLAVEGDLLGVPSFFLRTWRTTTTVTAVEDAELAWIEASDQPGVQDALESRLMPLVVCELTRRQNKMRNIMAREREAEAQLRQMEKLSGLGQMAAAVAHELNNAMAVIARGAEWLPTAMASTLASAGPLERELFQIGHQDGRRVSADEVREQTKQITKQARKLGFAQARQVAQMGLADDLRKRLLAKPERLPAAIQAWELGATLADIGIAARQSEHVVTSMKNLGAERVREAQEIDINATIDAAVAILRNVLKGIEVTCDFAELPSFAANRGELVQVWTNLIKNAADALHDQQHVSIEAPAITITTRHQGNEVMVSVSDNGPGISASVLPRIFEPNVTTKKNGLQFGLGIGLAIVARIVHGYHGRIDAFSPPGSGATFTIALPVAVHDQSPDRSES